VSAHVIYAKFGLIRKGLFQNRS